METNQTWSLQVTARVRATIKAAGLTEEYVGEQAGIPNSTFSRQLNLEKNGRYPLTLLDLEKIAAILGVSPEVFLPFQAHQKAS